MHQYIGSRYVPKFMGVYDATQIYEALCVVDNGLGTSYISKVPTPAGTPLTDTDYWAIYGASSGAIINLQNQIDDMNDGSVSGSLQNQINEMNDGTVSGSLQNQLDEMDRHVDWSKANVIFLADSYGSRVTSGGDHLLVAVGDRLGCASYDQFYAGGIGFTNHGGNGTFLQLLQNSTVTIPSDEVSHIVVVGGTNDHDETPADILAAINSFATYAKSTYPNAEIIIGCDAAPRFSKSRLEAVKITANVYKLGMTRGCKYMWGLENVLHLNDYLEADEVHPNTSGVDALVAAMVGNLKTGYWSVNYDVTPTLSFNSLNTGFSAGSVVGTLKFTLRGDYGLMIASFGWLTLTLASVGVIPTARQKIFTLNHKCVVGDTSPTIAMTALLCLVDSSNVVIDKAPCKLYIDEDGDLSVIININNFPSYATTASLRIEFVGNATFELLGC